MKKLLFFPSIFLLFTSASYSQNLVDSKPDEKEYIVSLGGGVSTYDRTAFLFSIEAFAKSSLQRPFTFILLRF